jgi:hypothetical protein
VNAVTDKRPRSGEHRMFRALFSVPKDDWTAFGEALKDTDRATVLRAFIAWFLRKPGAKLPQRPPADDHD